MDNQHMKKFSKSVTHQQTHNPILVPQGTVALTSGGSINDINYVFHECVASMMGNKKIKK